ncbi:hypothetical protein TRFO_33019 [Tritrichomonas foetus]|uniref:Uncharacterized protein n=1 Tax=Tritrichomonas foetus TaxID=1144522 RepID=A0A1J4JS77_9EUKA|nr:hypothetical protein TRFO_33019 [Tritrichomonas foetus]|eukprot:OHT00366.1 hypothetical protein TRFO_33019 [Tritrichomonas foetus]
MSVKYIISSGYNENGELGRECDSGKPYGKVPGTVEGLEMESISIISTGNSFSVALLNDGSILGWGDNKNGSLGFPKNIKKVKLPTKIPGLPKIIDVKCGNNFILFLTEDWKVLISSSENKNSLFDEIDIGEPAVAVFGYLNPWICGKSGSIIWYDHIETKTIQKYGPYPFGIPKQLVSIGEIVVLVTSSGEALIMSLKKLRPWTFHNNSTAFAGNDENFVPIESLQGVKIKKIAGHVTQMLVLSEDQRVFVFGNNGFGKLGLDPVEYTDTSNEFIELAFSRDLKIVDIGAGMSFSIFIDALGHVLAFGEVSGGEGMLGDDDEGSMSSIVEGAIGVHCGDCFTLVEIGDIQSAKKEEASSLMKTIFGYCSIS